ncbi:hypothetical protein AQUCO_05700104v1 [Aquilegia coerulea]|uniref:C3HC-type domain-containing protein n=4 Tax=Aquilegia coerulea TaxID=218851 RepID=A0A2G5CFU7_AQUCA|nr:hypothetical protein AQUCO_05700104v1 [Aquilegia coerulea]PIA30169.1 hypothetical protein AQUCO_05700104v1 [Aquilegia coerulea]
MEFFRSREAEMREEVISSGGPLDPLLLGRSSSPPQTPGASSAGASSPSVPVNTGNADWFSLGQGSKAGSFSCVGSHPARNSLSTTAGGSALGSSQPSCRPWERGDLLRRLATFNPSNWSGKPKVASSLACARRGWVNVDVDKIVCESCGANLSFVLLASWTSTEAENATDAFVKQLDFGHKRSCPWRGNICAESLVQFPPTPPSALIGGFKDRCDGLFQFVSLPVIAASAISQMRDSRSLQIDRLLSQSEILVNGEQGCTPGLELSRADAFSIYSQAQKLISLCGWEPRWLLNIQDCEEHSAQSARDGYSSGPNVNRGLPSQNPGTSKNAITAVKKDTGKKKIIFPESRCESRSPMLDCSLCGATVRIWDFLTVPRPARLAPNNIGTPEISKKMELTRGVSAASGISGWVPADDMEKEQPEGPDEAAIDEVKSVSNIGVDLNLTMAGVLESTQLNTGVVSGQFRDETMGRDLRIGQPSGSEVGDRAASFESRGPSTRKRHLEGGGSTVDRPQLQVQQADSVEGTVIDRDGDEVDDGTHYSAGPSKRSRDSDMYHSSYRRDTSGAGPSHSFGFGIDIDVNRSDPFQQGNYQALGLSSARDSARASSVIAMDTVGRSADEDSMESVENYPADYDDVHFSSPTAHRNPDINDASELNYSNQAQQSACFQPGGRVDRELGVSSTNDGEEIVNAETVTANARDRFSFGVSGGSVGMGASHEAEIHGAALSFQRTDSVVGEAELIAEVTENQGQTGESAPDPGLMGEFVPEEVDREDPHGDSHDMMSRSIGRDDSGSKIDGVVKADSVESGEKMSENRVIAHDNSAHPSHSCNAVVYSGYEVSKDEVSQGGKASINDDCTVLESEYVAANGIGPPNGESNYDEPTEFDPIKHHNRFCPWVNGNVAAAGCGDSGSSSSIGALALCGWQQTLDALDAFQSLDHIPIQTVPSESAASLCKDDHHTSSKKTLAHPAGSSRSHGNK